MPQYLVACFARSAVRLPPGQQIEVLLSPASTLPVTKVVVRSRYLPAPNEDAAAGLEIRVLGQAPGVRRAAEWFGRVADEVLPIISLAGNGAIESARLLGAYDVSPNVAERDWLQTTSEDLEPEVRFAHKIEASVAGPVIDAVYANPSVSRVTRVISHYRDAILNWERGQELTATEHLQIAAETLTPVCVDRVLAKRGMTISELAAEWEFDRRRGAEKPFVASRLRLAEIYDGENDVRRDLERASNGYEHGDVSFEEAGALACKSRDRAAQLIRRAILRETGLGSGEIAALSASKFEPPLGIWAPRRMWLGTMAVQDEAMLAADAALIRMRLSHRFKAAHLTNGGEFAVQVDLHGDGSVLPEGAAITPESQAVDMPVGLNPADQQPTVALSEPRITHNGDSPPSPGA
jgi:hypothetical protein